ncbi:MAG: FtsQ-type POTRA domain-containing protein [Blastocatellia bacterium]|nr:FtsQ-type POTRA domain-containing protein [Blastocatellia bacterium]
MAIKQKGVSSLRAQVVTPRTSRRVKRARTSRGGNLFKRKTFFLKYLQSAVGFAKPAAVLVAVLLVIWGYNAVADSSLFELGRIEVDASSPKLRADIEETVRRSVGQTKLLGLDIANVREKVESLVRVRTATVARVLPDGISVTVVERRPAVLARRKSNALVWLDEDGVELGDDINLRGELSGEGLSIPPIMTGLVEDDRSRVVPAQNRERIKIYKHIEEEFKKEPNPLWNLLDEIDLTFTEHVKLQLANSTIMIHVGDQDFRNRFQTAIQVLAAIKQGDTEMLNRFKVQSPEQLIANADNISFIDVARTDRIVLNFSAPGKEKAVRQEEKRK